MTAPSPHSVAAEFVAKHLRDWIAPHGPVMVGEVRTNATGVLVRELAALIERERAKNPMDAFMELATACGLEPDPEQVARMRAYLEATAT